MAQGVCRCERPSKRNAMRNLTKIILIGGTSVMLALTGCEMVHSDSDRTAGRQLDDKTITQNIRNQLASDPVYKFNEVDVKTFDGVVQLSGFVDTDAQKRIAGDVAQRVPGVTQVQNDIALIPNQNGNLQPTGGNYNNGYNNNQPNNQPSH